jgi:hypothetical protein
VWLAFVALVHRHQRPTSGRVSSALRLRAKPDGTIVTPHRADTFAEIGEGDRRSRLHQRRNETVQWSLSVKEQRALREAIRRHVGAPLPLSFGTT